MFSDAAFVKTYVQKQQTNSCEMLCVSLACAEALCYMFLSLCFRNLPFILNWVKSQKPGVMGVNIITSDFVELVDFAASVIALNNLLLEENNTS